MIPQHIREAANGAPPQFEEAGGPANPPSSTCALQSSTGAATRQGIKDALFSIALRGLRAGKASADLARQCGNANVAHALERFATEALTRQQVFVAQQRRTREANKQFGRDLNQAGVEIRQHSEADFVHVLVTALTMFEENEKVSVTGALARAYPDDPGKARSIGNSNNHKRYQKALHSHAVQKHVALADAVRAGIRELNRCAGASLESRPTAQTHRCT